jgi:hypothetical protein
MEDELKKWINRGEEDHKFIHISITQFNAALEVYSGSPSDAAVKMYESNVMVNEMVHAMMAATIERLKQVERPYRGFEFVFLKEKKDG